MRVRVPCHEMQFRAPSAQHWRKPPANQCQRLPPPGCRHFPIRARDGQARRRGINTILQAEGEASSQARLCALDAPEYYRPKGRQAQGTPLCIDVTLAAATGQHMRAMARPSRRKLMVEEVASQHVARGKGWSRHE